MSTLSELLREANVEELSYQRIEDRAKELGVALSHGTAHKYMTGRYTGAPDRTVLAAFAIVFPSLKMIDLETAAQLPPDRGMYTPPSEAHTLNEAERNALTLIIKSMAAGKPSASQAAANDEVAQKRQTREAAKQTLPAKATQKAPAKKAARPGASSGRSAAKESDKLGEGDQTDPRATDGESTE